MAKFNRPQARSAPTSPVTTQPGPANTTTHEGAPAWKRDAKSELFSLGVTNFVGEDTFYERAEDRDARYARLIAEVAVSDPDWTGRFLRWLRKEGKLRSAPLVGALTAAKAMTEKGIPGSREIINGVMQRADEPGEAVACWQNMFGRVMPQPVKRGIADAACRLYTQFSAAKYDSKSHAVRFGDVLNLTHPKTLDPEQADLFGHLLDVRYGNADEIPERLTQLIARRELLDTPVGERRARLLDDPGVLKRAAMTWESVAGWIQGPMDAEVWKALIPVMGIQALARNLRNFDEAGVDDAAIDPVLAKLTDAHVIARSRMMPFEWLKAYVSVSSLRWGYALEQAAKLSVSNIPELTGRTLVLIDASGSMTQSYSKRSQLSAMQSAALLGLALAAKHGPDVEVHGFASGVFPFPLVKGASVLRQVETFCSRYNSVGVGTNGFGALKQTYRDHDRVLVLTDMQFAAFEGSSYHELLPGDRYRWSEPVKPPETPSVRDFTRHSKKGDIPVYFFNTAGYAQVVSPLGQQNVHELGGVTDATFKMIRWIEECGGARWPF